MWASGARSPEAPTEPWPGMTGIEVRLQAGGQMLDRRPAHARGALREARELQRHHQPHDGSRQRLADAGGMREHDVALERREIGGADAHAGELSEAGVDAVDRLALRDDGLDGPGAGLDGGAAILIERDRARRNRCARQSASGTEPG